MVIHDTGVLVWWTEPISRSRALDACFGTGQYALDVRLPDRSRCLGEKVALSPMCPTCKRKFHRLWCPRLEHKIESLLIPAVGLLVLDALNVPLRLAGGYLYLLLAFLIVYVIAVKVAQKRRVLPPSEARLRRIARGRGLRLRKSSTDGTFALYDPERESIVTETQCTLAEIADYLHTVE